MKIQVEAHVWTDSFLATDPITHEITSYQMLRGPQISDHAASTHLRQINNSLKYVQFPTGLIRIFALLSSSDLTRSGNIYDWQSVNVVE